MYKRNAQGKPIRWECVEQEHTLIISTGLVGKTNHTDIVERKRVKKNEFDARVEEKRKQGYKEVSELYDNAPNREQLIKSSGLLHYLNLYLPKYNTTNTGFILPMLAKVLEDNKPFEKHKYLGQWKINGVRCIIKAKRVNNDIFRSYRFRYYSREGTEWTNMDWFDEILNQKVSSILLSAMLEENVALDGEFYLPGYNVNDINSFVKNDSLPQHFQLQYWCYDLCWDNLSYDSRRKYRDEYLNAHVTFFTADHHLNNKQQFLVLPDYEVTDITVARIFRDEFIDMGFEGLIIRNTDALYQFGKRNMSMMKYKKILDGKFNIVDIVPEGVRKNLPKFVLINDINSELFEATINAPHSYQEDILATKESYIGKDVLVEYRERSGVKQVPFHAKIIKIL